MITKLIQLYQQMADLTRPECAQCALPYHCCSEEYCGYAIDYAREKYSVDLEPTGHPKLPMMGETGCVVPPHMRPMCTMHTCDILHWGFKPHDDSWTQKYFDLRDRIGLLEYGIDDSNNV